ncbi:mitochondrial ornithine transporter 1 [Trichomonascus vanleenenianus]|uniref:mitochondrial ornithine transporter 1 n=1 Tax=Trichomonascus vanleenenianus TaxID=2268995 RepID=UPI003ECA54FE
MENNELLALSTRDSILDVVFGSIAGSTGKLIEFPFDTVKVRLQSQPETRPLQFKGPLDCLRQSLAQEGVLGLYRGISSPIIGASAETASLFVFYNWSKKLVAGSGMSELATSLVCGSMSGAFTSFILTPIELVKCQIQVQSVTGGQKRGLIAQTLHIYRHSGLGGFWKGQTGTLLRECGGSAAWFGANEYVKKALRRYNGRDTNTTPELLLGGAAAGVAYNFSLFPADTIKSRIQTDPGATGGFWATGRQMVRAGGISALYRGCGITVCRSAPSSAIIFFTYESLKDLVAPANSPDYIQL